MVRPVVDRVGPHGRALDVRAVGVALSDSATGVSWVGQPVADDVLRFANGGGQVRAVEELQYDGRRDKVGTIEFGACAAPPMLLPSTL